MNLWLWNATVLLAALIPCGVVCFRGPVEDRIVGLEMTGLIVVLEMLLLSQGFHRVWAYDLPLTLAILSLGGGLVFVRFLQRWL